MKQAHYPPNHQPAIRVPKGGSSCVTCTFLKDNGECGSKDYIAYYGSGKLGAAPDEFCSDWYTPRPGTVGGRKSPSDTERGVLASHAV